MALVKESRCETEYRKDCSLKRICQFRHANEEIGKDLEYYTRKFDRAAGFIQGDFNTIPEENTRVETGTCDVPVSSTYFPVTNFNRG